MQFGLQRLARKAAPWVEALMGPRLPPNTRTWPRTSARSILPIARSRGTMVAATNTRQLYGARRSDCPERAHIRRSRLSQMGRSKRGAEPEAARGRARHRGTRIGDDAEEWAARQCIEFKVSRIAEEWAKMSEEQREEQRESYTLVHSNKPDGDGDDDDGESETPSLPPARETSEDSAAGKVPRKKRCDAGKRRKATAAPAKTEGKAPLPSLADYEKTQTTEAPAGPATAGAPKPRALARAVSSSTVCSERQLSIIDLSSPPLRLAQGSRPTLDRTGAVMAA